MATKFSDNISVQSQQSLKSNKSKQSNLSDAIYSGLQQRDFNFKIKEIQRDLQLKFTKKYGKGKKMNQIYIDKIVRDLCKKMIQNKSLKINPSEIKHIETRIQVYSNMEGPYLMNRENITDTDSTITFQTINTQTSLQSRKSHTKSVQSNNFFKNNDNNNIQQNWNSDRKSWASISQAENYSVKDKIKDSSANIQNMFKHNEQNTMLYNKRVAENPQYNNTNPTQKLQINTTFEYKKKNPQNRPFTTQNSFNQQKTKRQLFKQQSNSIGGFVHPEMLKKQSQSQDSFKSLTPSNFQFKAYKKQYKPYQKKQSQQERLKEKQENLEIIKNIMSSTLRTTNIPGITLDEKWQNDLLSVTDSNVETQSQAGQFLNDKIQDLKYIKQIQYDAQLQQKENLQKLKNKQLQQKQIRDALAKQISQKQLKKLNEYQENMDFAQTQELIKQSQEKNQQAKQQQDNLRRFQFQKELREQLRQNKRNKRDQKIQQKDQNNFYTQMFEKEKLDDIDRENMKKQTQYNFLNTVMKESLKEQEERKQREKEENEREYQEFKEFNKILNENLDLEEQQKQERRDAYRQELKNAYNPSDYETKTNFLRETQELKKYQDTLAEREKQEDLKEKQEKFQKQKEIQEVLRQQVLEKQQKLQKEKQIDAKQAQVWKDDYLESLKLQSSAMQTQTQAFRENSKLLKDQIKQKNMEKLIQTCKADDKDQLLLQHQFLQDATEYDPILANTKLSDFRRSQQNSVSKGQTRYE